jgi:hypothetical protein
MPVSTNINYNSIIYTTYYIYRIADRVLDAVWIWGNPFQSALRRVQPGQIHLFGISDRVSDLQHLLATILAIQDKLIGSFGFNCHAE